ncbi:MAG TPA: hypothetical protein VFW07_21575 [Parafilimonas sp.]|nr:hypothetical protein [Parafilimonas sp.]
MTLKKPFLTSLIFSLISILSAHAQTTFEVPQGVELKSKEDYAKYEPAIIDAAKWLEETDLDKETDKRKEVNSFVLQWIAGSPTVNIDINEKLSKIYGKNVQLLGIYLAGYTRNFLENKNAATKFSATKAGLISMMNVYKKGIAVSKSKEMEKLTKLTGENDLDDYINENFK